MTVLGMMLLLLVLIGLTFARDNTNQPIRLLVCAVLFLMALLFMTWRVTALSSQDETWVWICTIVDVIGLTDFLVFVVMLCRTVDRTPQADAGEQRYRALPHDTLPDVDVWIATYDEEWAILEKTIIGALALDWPPDKLHIVVLDDSRRDWLRDKCALLGVGYLRRADNRDRKAGNHNHALANTSAPFILSLDADFIPFPNALYRLIGLMDDPIVAIVQSPQTFYNPSPLTNNLLMQHVLPDDLSFFYQVMQPARDAWNSAFYCGTAALLRRQALQAVGGFATESDIEDQITSMRLWQHGWATRYLNERLSTGLAPESTAAMHDQRNRWCRGSLQILFTRHGPACRGFSLAQRCFFAQTFWVLGAVLPLFYAILPIPVWGFGCRLFGHSPAIEILWMPILLLSAIWTGFLWLGRGTWLPIVTPAIQLALAVEMLPTALATLIKPFGRSLIRIRPVTAKGDRAVRQRFDRPTTGALLALATLILGSVLVSAFFPSAVLRDQFERIEALAWTIYDLVVVGVALLTCFQLPYRRTEERTRLLQPGMLRLPNVGLVPVRLRDLSLSGAGLRLAGHWPVAVGDTVVLDANGIGLLRGSVARVRPAEGGWNSVGIAFGTLLSDDMRQRLIRHVFLGSEKPGDDPRIDFGGLLAGLAGRIGRTDF